MAQRLQHVTAAARGADQPGRRGQRQQQAQALAEHAARASSAGSASKARSITAATMARKAQPVICTQVGTTGISIHHAVASNSMPNRRLTPSIHGPALGSSAPDEAPTISSGTPMPQAIANRAEPPSTTSPVCEMYSAPASGAATQGPTIRADNAPISSAPV